MKYNDEFKENMTVLFTLFFVSKSIIYLESRVRFLSYLTTISCQVPVTESDFMHQ